jgi:hypothetical protein
MSVNLIVVQLATIIFLLSLAGELCFTDAPLPNVGAVIRHTYASDCYTEDVAHGAARSCHNSTDCHGARADDCRQDDRPTCSCHSSSAPDKQNRYWRPLLLIIPMRLGLSEINPIYFSAIKVCQVPMMKHCLIHNNNSASRVEEKWWSFWHRCVSFFWIDADWFLLDVRFHLPSWAWYHIW